MLFKRVFWMGSHKILIPTELKALQDMGYETFYPPYLGKERDQSAVYDWKCPPTTLPKDVIAKLCGYNFFWNEIDDEIAEILNSYFDCVVVTINGDWLLSFLKVFKGTIIYRTFGEPYSLSAHLKSNGAYPLIESHPDFWFMPHCLENAVREEWWLRRRERVVPYSLTPDVLSRANTWDPDLSGGGLIGLTCPNVLNPYYNAHFRYLKAHFEERMYRYYGVQVDRFSDLNVVGTLEREEQLDQFTGLAGFLYTYREPNVCYLPPVEMITLGGPVLYLPGSLLDRYLKQENAGRVADEEEARRAARRLAAGDRHLGMEIVASQRGVALRYDSSHTLPIFRSTMEEILPLTAPNQTQRHLESCGKKLTTAERPVLLLAHFAGTYGYSGGEYVSVHGIPRVMRRAVQVLTEAGRRVTVTARPEALNETWGFYASQTSRPDLLDVIDVNHVTDTPEPHSAPRDVRAYFREVRNGGMHWIDGQFSMPVVLAGGLVRLFGGKKRIKESKQASFDTYSYVIVPHYYLFPEAVEFASAKLLVYLPDYMPHFFKGRGWFPEDESHKAIGRKLVRMSDYVMTNSVFTKQYLPFSDLEVDEDKIIAFPLPHLANRGDQAVDGSVQRQLEQADFIFYPTQPHPNKRLDLLAKAWLGLRAKSRGNVKLVLTCGALPPDLQRLVSEEGAEDDVVFLPGISDATLAWLYQKAICLAFTSEMEGNFPTQIIEALELECPIVTFDHPTIQSELGPEALNLQSAPFADLDVFIERILFVRRNRKKVIATQRRMLARIGDRFSYAAYRTNMLKLDELMKNTPEDKLLQANFEDTNGGIMVSFPAQLVD